MGKNFARSLGLPTTTTRVVKTLQMLFTNLIMITHVNRTTEQPPMNSIDTCAENPRRGYLKPYVLTLEIPHQRNGHFVKPNKVALKYPNIKKYVDLNVHVRMFNFVTKANAKTSK
jgi:hypothetical protein